MPLQGMTVQNQTVLKNRINCKIEYRKKTNRYDVRMSACLSDFYKQLILISSGFVNIFMRFKADTCSSGS